MTQADLDTIQAAQNALAFYAATHLPTPFTSNRYWHQPWPKTFGLELEYNNAYYESTATDTCTRNEQLHTLWMLTH